MNRCHDKRHPIGSRRVPLLAATAMVIATAQGLPACDQASKAAALGRTDSALIEALIPYERVTLTTEQAVHHRTRHRVLGLLTARVAATQQAEIRQLAAIARHAGTHLTPDALAYRRLPLTLVQRNWVSVEVQHTHTVLGSATRSGRDAINALYGRYAGALYMAQAALGSERDSSLRALTRQIIDARQRWLDQLDALSVRYYGAPVQFE